MLVTVCIFENLKGTESEGRNRGRFVLPEHNVDDERVSHETTDTDEGVEYLDDRHHVGWQPPAPLITLGQHFAAVILKL